MKYELEWCGNASVHLGAGARTGTEVYFSFEDLLNSVPRACGGLEMGLEGNGVLTPLIQDSAVLSDKDILFWKENGLGDQFPLYAKAKDSLAYQDIRPGDARSVEIGTVKIYAS